MYKAIKYLPAPVFDPSSAEITACEAHRLIIFGSGGPSAGILRTLVYSTIAGRTALPLWAGSRIQEHDLLIAAHLNPPVWGVTRSLEQQLYIHYSAFCLGCQSYYGIEEGSPCLLRAACGNCWESMERADIQELPFWYTCASWPVRYQRDLIDHLVAASKDSKEEYYYQLKIT